MRRAVIFDMDGLLIDSEPLWRKAEREVFSTVGIDITDEMAEATKALRTDEVTQYWFRFRPWTGPALADVENAVIDRVADLMRLEGRAKQGVDYLLSFFAGRGYRIGLASNSPDVLIEIATTKLGIAAYFSAAVSSVHEQRGKPDPAVYLTAAAKLGVPPARCVVFEDSVAGLVAAKGAGMKTVAVPPPERYDDEGFAIADLRLPSLDAFGPEHEAALVLART